MRCHLFGKTQTVKNDFGLGGDGAFIEFSKRSYSLCSCHIIGGFFKGFFSSYKRCVTGKHPVDRHFIHRVDILRDVSNVLKVRRGDFTCFNRNFAQDGRQKARFPAAVVAHKTHAFTGIG